MQPAAGEVHVFRLGCRIKKIQNQSQPSSMVGLYSASAARSEKNLKALVRKGTYHAHECNQTGYDSQGNIIPLPLGRPDLRASICNLPTFPAWTA